ncbi:MAG: hypothetical protein ABS68_03065 [Niastella sp. SCN 39-18]|nr:DUF4296 domain-containing protein [Sphingobacteriales bacterium]ODT53964.1 MAG: hypothetical protein ABS68_03065 [Niastella sp. SCN 39-18]OJW09880.1 MAG: hypothetical protein BGO53_08620 [Sphingobacteriales bacterium 39-19]
MRSFFIFISILFLVSCNADAPPAAVLSKDSMQVIMWEMIQADVYTYEFAKADSLHSRDEQSIRMQQAIFNKHHISKQNFDKSYDYYTRHSKLMTQMLDSITAQYNRIPDTSLLPRRMMDIKPVQEPPIPGLPGLRDSLKRQKLLKKKIKIDEKNF